jgi:hypothetical protein
LDIHIAYERLTPTRARILGMLAERRTIHEVAASMDYSYNGARSRIAELKEITGASSLHELGEWWERNRDGWAEWIADAAHKPTG